MRAQRTTRPALESGPHAPRELARAGFTLMELLVATALILFIMAIIAQAFGAASKTFTTMRTAGQLQERNRTATNIIRKDLWADHFGPPFGTYGGTHVMHQRLDLAGWRPPTTGYFEMGQGNPSRYEPGDPTLAPDGLSKTFYSSNPANPTTNPPVLPPLVLPSPPPYIADGEQLYSTRARDHFMGFTVRLPQGPAAELFSGLFHPLFTSDPRANAFLLSPGDGPTSTPGVMYSRWAEVCYFVMPTGPQPPQPPDPAEMTVGNNPRPLHTLYRRVRLLPPRELFYFQSPTTGLRMTFAEAQQIEAQCRTQFPDVIAPNALKDPVDPLLGGLRLPGPETLNRERGLRLTRDLNPQTVGGSRSGYDILLTDVISFEIRPTWINNVTFNQYFATAPPIIPSPAMEGMNEFNTDEPFSDLPRTFMNGAFPTGYFDTWGDPGTVDWDNPAGTSGFLLPGADKPPSRINVRGLQIKIRIWDKKAEQARQATIINEL